MVGQDLGFGGVLRFCRGGCCLGLADRGIYVSYSFSLQPATVMKSGNHREEGIQHNGGTVLAVV